MNWIDFWADEAYDENFWAPRSEYYAIKLIDTGLLSKEKIVLDYGSGPGYLGRYISENVAKLVLAEPSSLLNERSIEINKYYENCESVIIDKLEERQSLFENRSFDLILVHSVIQYMPYQEVGKLSDMFLAGLKPGGSVLISDVIPPGTSFSFEMMRLLGFYMRIKGMLGFIRFVCTELKKYRQRIGMDIYKYDPDDIKEAFGDNFSIEEVANPSVSKSRKAYLLRPLE
jgi:SAM-dependent methyltransferase